MLVLSFSLVTAVPVAAATTHNVIPFTLAGTGSNTSEWSTAQFNTGSHSVKLTHLGGASIRAYVQFTPPTGITLAEFVAAPATYGFSYWRTEDKIGPQLELTFTDGSNGTVELWAEMALYDYVTDDLTGQWIVKTASATEQCGYYGTGSSSTAFDYTAEGLGDLSDLITDMGGDNADDDAAAMGLWEMTKVIVECGWSGDTQTAYVDDIIIAGVTYYGHISDTIAIAAAGDTVVVAVGTYTADISIPAGKDNLELKPATGAAVTIKGVETEPDASFPLAVPNIDILSPGVKIHGFTIEGPDAVTDEYASGMLIGAANVEIYDNDFKVTAGRATWAGGAISTGIITYRKTAIPTVDISGLNIHENTFTNHGDGAAGFDAIFINLDTGTTTATIADNEFTGNLNRAIIAERSNMVISGNSIITALAPRDGSAGSYKGILIGCWPLSLDPLVAGPVQSNVSVIGNTVKGATSSDGFTQGIRIGHSSQLGLTNITVLRNVVEGNATGIRINPDASGVTVNYNEITGNDVGVQNDDAGVELDAEYNWYGGVAGPVHTDNPYNTEAGNQVNDSVSDDVDFLPWMIHDTLVSGWNIWSTPIAAATGYEGEPDTNTVEEALDFWTADSSKVIDAYCFNSATQAWVVPTSLTPLQAVYLNLSASATIDVCVSDSNYAPPGRTMHLGWNLVGTADWDDDKLVDAALLSAEYGTGAVNLIGYQYVISPSIHQTSWTFTRGVTTATDEYFIPTEGYWVYMVNQGVLNGFTYTPIVEVAP